MPVGRGKILLLTGVVLLIIVGALAAVYVLTGRPAAAPAAEVRPPARSGSGSAAPQVSPTPAFVVPVTPARAVAYLAKTTGNLASANQASLGFQASGRIRSVQVKEGDRVKAGDVLATLDTAALDAQVVQAQAALDSAAANLAKVRSGPTVDDTVVAKSNLDRARATLDQAQAAYDRAGGATNPGIAASTQALALEQATSSYQAAIAQYNLTINHPTDTELKAAQSAVAQAQATLEMSKQNASSARITAPFDGIVIWVGSKLGESATSGSPALTVADLGRMQVQVNADQFSGSLLQVGQSVSITVDALSGKTLTGRISKIGLLATASGNLVSTPVTIDIDPTSALIYPGLSATVEFQGKSQ